MKRFTGIFMIVVVVMVMVMNVALADDYLNYEDSIKLLHEWGNNYGYEYCVNEVEDNGWFYYCGCLDKTEFEEWTGLEATPDNYDKWSVNEAEWDMISCYSKQVGEIEGHAVYYCVAMANKTLAKDYKNVGVLWMICD